MNGIWIGVIYECSYECCYEWLPMNGSQGVVAYGVVAYETV